MIKNVPYNKYSDAQFLGIKEKTIDKKKYIGNELELVARDYQSKLIIIKNLTVANNKLKMVYELNKQIASTIKKQTTRTRFTFYTNKNEIL